MDRSLCFLSHSFKNKILILGKLFFTWFKVLFIHCIQVVQKFFLWNLSGFVGRKNYANVAVRNLLDVIIGGLAYWFFGYAFSFGSRANGMSGKGYYFTSFDFESETAGYNYAFYALQLSYAVKINSIMSGKPRRKLLMFIFLASRRI